MPFYHQQNVLNGGELSPLMRGRVDQPRYSTGAQEMLNFVPMPQGGVTRRPGTRFLGRALHASGRLIPFVFSSTQGRMLEFGERVMRVWLPDGRLVTKDEAILEVETPFAASELAALRYAQSADVIYFAHPAHAPCKVSRHADDDWRFETLTFMPGVSAPEMPGLAIRDNRDAENKPEKPSMTDYTYQVTAVGEDGVESMPSPPATITAEALNSTDYHIRVTWKAVEGAAYYRIYKKKLGVFGYIGRAGTGDTTEENSVVESVSIGGFRFLPLTLYFRKYVHTSFPSSDGGEPAVTETKMDVSRTPQFSGQEPVTGWYNADLKQLFLFQKKTPFSSGKEGWFCIHGVPASYTGTYEDFSFEYAEAFGTNPAYPQGILGSVNAVPSFISLYGQYYDDKNIGADTEDTPPEYGNPFQGEGNYPSQVFFHQQRLGFASSQNRPVTVWLSRSGEFESMATSTPPRDNDAIEVTLATTQANRIVWLQPDRNALAFGTEGSEWTLAPSEGVALTPSTVSFQLQTANGGSGDVAALPVGGGILYVQRGSGAVREFAYSYSSDKYLGQDLTILARHILKDVSIRAWTFQQEPYSVVWCVLSDGTLAGLTFMKEQEIIGWHRHGTEGAFLDAAGLPGTPDDQLWFLVRRGEAVFVERLDTFFDAENLTEAHFLDASLNYQGEAADHFSGLAHLAGREVQVFADGGTIDGLHVSDEGTLDLKNPATAVHVGLPYTSRLVPNLPEIQSGQGSSFLHNRKIRAVRVRVYRSMAFRAGLGGHAVPIVDRQIRSGHFTSEPFFSEGTDLALDLCGGWAEETPLSLEVRSATPLTILAILTALDVSPYSGKGGF